jgi:hypothetical protein
LVALRIPPEGATGVSAYDFADGNNAGDIYASFQKSTDDQWLTEYRAMLVKQSSISSMDLTVALAVPPTSYHSITPTGNDIEFAFPFGMLDSDGDAPVSGVDYRVVVMNLGDFSQGYLDALSTASNQVSLLESAEATTNLLASDGGDTQTGQDLQLSFEMVSDESRVLNYGLIVVKEENAATFSIHDAKSLPNVYMEILPPLGNDINFEFNSFSTDNQGDIIVENVSYTLFVLTMATDDYSDALSAPSNTITLGEDVGISETAPFQNVQLFPNPTNGSFNLAIDVLKNKDITISITNATGQEIYFEKLDQSVGSILKEIDLNQPTKGIYHVNLTSGSSKLTKSISVK